MGDTPASPRWRSRSRPSAGATLLSVLLVAAAMSAPAAGDVGSRVVNGSLAKPGRYPFVAAILASATADQFDAQFCGASVVASRTVITAAHCVEDYPSIDVLVNTNRLESGHGDRIPVTSILVHPRWDPVTARNDVALLHLASPSHAQRVQVIPRASDFRAAPRRTARVAGFGCVEYDSSASSCRGYPDRMYETPLPLLADSTCRSMMGPGYNAKSMRCAGTVSATGLAPDACFGDSGGPLVVDGPAGSGRAFLVGLVSWGWGCGTGPSAYTRLSSYRRWLKANGVPMRGPFRRGPEISKGGSPLPVPGDFDGDGRTDVLWHTPNASGDVLWRGRPSGFERSGLFAFGNRGAPVVGDFDGDGLDDILWYRRGSRRDRLTLGTPSGFARGPDVDIGGRYRPASGDFDGDGHDDIFWYGPGDGAEVLWRGRASGFTTESVHGRGGDYDPVSGDFDGDGHDDILWFDAGQRRDQVWLGTGTGFTVGGEQSISGSYDPVSGDFDGDGYADIFWHHPGDGHNIVWHGSAGGFGLFDDVGRRGADRAVSGDFDGNGRSDMLLFGEGADPDTLLRGNHR